MSLNKNDQLTLRNKLKDLLIDLSTEFEKIENEHNINIVRLFLSEELNSKLMDYYDTLKTVFENDDKLCISSQDIDSDDCLIGCFDENGYHVCNPRCHYKYGNNIEETILALNKILFYPETAVTEIKENLNKNLEMEENKTHKQQLLEDLFVFIRNTLFEIKEVENLGDLNNYYLYIPKYIFEAFREEKQFINKLLEKEHEFPEMMLREVYVPRNAILKNESLHFERGIQLDPKIIDNIFKEFENKENRVDHPNHYQGNKYECWDVLEDWQSTEKFKGAMEFNIFKYLKRYDEENGKGIEDLKKAQNYLQKLIEVEEES